MRLFVYSSTLILVLAGAAQAQTSTQTLTGKMAVYNYLLGAPWTCTSPGGSSMVTFDVVGPATMHVHVAAPPYVADSYYGYTSQGDSYWGTTADSNGMASSERSADGNTYSGTATAAGASAPIQHIFAKVSDKHSTTRSTITINGKQQVIDTDCTR